MLRFLLRGSFSAFFVFLLFNGFSQGSTPKTLLWRITGNGLQKPSYLFGTMHLQDKRLFQFGDSLYHALESTDGFAMEIDAAEFVDSLMSSIVRGEEKEEDEKLDRQKVKLDRKKLDKSADSLLQKFGIRGGVATKKDLKRIRDFRTAQLLKQGEMPTIVDAYLLGIALRLKKWTGGIEDVSDQLNLSDELGGELEPEDILIPEKQFRQSLETMISVYLAQDLDRIFAISNQSYSEEKIDLLLVNRNIKMAHRMDSLSHVRPMFFAVGAAHLPGDSGVITLLQKKGYRVEPVFSSSKIAADSYASKLQQLTWTTIEDEQGTYTVQMPGKATDYKVDEVMTMKFFFDITTMTFYFSGSATGGPVKPEMADQMLKEMVRNFGGKQGKTKLVQTAGLTGKEAYAENEEGSYRVRVFNNDKTLFFLMVGALKKANVQSADADRFFDSFAPSNKAAPEEAWETFSLPEKAFSVRMPGKPTISKTMDQRVTDADSSWKSISYQAFDAGRQVYYLVQVRETKEGFFIDGDSAYIELLRENYRKTVDQVLREEKGSFQGYPALYMDGFMKELNSVYKSIQVIRGNRVYLLLAGMSKDSDTTGMEKFFRSFTLLPQLPAVYKTEQAGRFSTWAPSPFRLVPPDSTGDAPFYTEHYTSYNEMEAVTYDVFIENFSPFYWTANDSTFFHEKMNSYKSENDSLVQKQWVMNGEVKGMDGLIRMPGYNTIKKVRLLLSADTLYTLFSMIPWQDVDKDHHQKFFAEFRLSKELPPTIYTPKTALLLAALQSPDSAVIEDAKAQLAKVEFSKDDLPALHQALLKNYNDTGSYYTIKDRLINITGELADSSTLSFIEKIYPSVKGDKVSSQYALLAVLAKTKTREAYGLLKHLLLTQLPPDGDPGMLHSALYDSLELTVALFPELLQHSTDSLFGRNIVMHATALIDSGLLVMEKILPYHDQVLSGALQVAARIKDGDEKVWEFANWTELLGKFNSEKGNALLRQMLTLQDVYIKQAIVLALLKNNQPVSAAEIGKVAADKVQRMYFYDELKKLKKEHLFPALYASQKSLAESELYNFISNEYTDDFTLTYVGERIELYEGRKKRFHLFKLRMDDEEERKQNFLAVAGPYDLNAKEKITSSDASGFYTGEEFSPAKTAKLLKAYLKDVKPAQE